MVLNVEMKMNLLSIKRLYLFLSLRLFNKYKTHSGKAFECLLNKTFSGHCKEQKRKTVIHKKLSFEYEPVKTFIDGISKRINLMINRNVTFNKLLFPILSAAEKKVFSSKKFLSLYNKLLMQNGSEPEKALIRLPEEWEKMNNLKQIYTSN